MEEKSWPGSKDKRKMGLKNFRSDYNVSGKKKDSKLMPLTIQMRTKMSQESFSGRKGGNVLYFLPVQWSDQFS